MPCIVSQCFGIYISELEFFRTIFHRPMNRLRFIKNGAYLGFGSMIGTSLLLDGCGDPFSALAIEFLIQEGIEPMIKLRYCADNDSWPLFENSFLTLLDFHSKTLRF